MEQELKITHFVEVELLQQAQLENCNPGTEGHLGDDVAVRMPDGKKETIFCDAPGLFSFRPHQNADIRLILMEQTGNLAKFGLTKERVDVIECLRPRLFDKLVAIGSDQA